MSVALRRSCGDAEHSRSPSHLPAPRQRRSAGAAVLLTVGLGHVSATTLDNDCLQEALNCLRHGPPISKLHIPDCLRRWGQTTPAHEMALTSRPAAFESLRAHQLCDEFIVHAADGRRPHLAKASVGSIHHMYGVNSKLCSHGHS